MVRIQHYCGAILQVLFGGKLAITRKFKKNMKSKPATTTLFELPSKVIKHFKLMYSKSLC